MNIDTNLIIKLIAVKLVLRSYLESKKRHKEGNKAWLKAV